MCAGSKHAIRTLAAALGMMFVLPVYGMQSASPSDDADALMHALAEKFGNREKKYEALARKVDKAVRKALEEATWQSGAGAGAQRSLDEHPLIVRIEELGAAARAKAPENPAATQGLLIAFPWSSELELTLGLQYGTDRAVPDHHAGFIELGMPLGGASAFPEFSINRYLFGMQEIVGWRFRVGTKRGPVFLGRGEKDKPELESALPGWERLRVYLHGSLPEVPLLAMPQLTHMIHARLAERRRLENGDPATMDRFMAFLDSKWNGFQVELPYAKKMQAFVMPVHDLFTDTTGFVYRFERSGELASVGDLPFIAIPTYQQYAFEFHGVAAEMRDFLVRNEKGAEMRARFVADSTYIKHYKSLIDGIVRAILTPDFPYPEYLGYMDYPEGKPPVDRAIDHSFDVPRTHALLVWAHAQQDPVKLADFIHDQLLSKEENTFPNGGALPVAFTLAVRELQASLLADLAKRVRSERASDPGVDFAREFTPFANPAETEGAPAFGCLIHSFHAFNRPVGETIRQAALGVVQKVLN